MTNFAVDDIVYELNERAYTYVRQGLTTEAAIQKAVEDWVHYLHGVGYRILSLEEIEQTGRTTFFVPYGREAG